MKKGIKALLGIIISITLVIVLGITNIVPYFAVIPDMVKVGIDYISLDRNPDHPGKKELIATLNETEAAHPFILADKNDFDIARNEYANGEFSDYTKKLTDYVFANADALLDTTNYPPMEYVLDEEDSILPISRETINRMVILGYAWQITGDEKYAYGIIKLFEENYSKADILNEALNQARVEEGTDLYIPKLLEYSEKHFNLQFRLHGSPQCRPNR